MVAIEKNNLLLRIVLMADKFQKFKNYFRKIGIFVVFFQF